MTTAESPWQRYGLPVILGAVGNGLWYFLANVAPTAFGYGRTVWTEVASALGSLGLWGYAVATVTFVGITLVVRMYFQGLKLTPSTSTIAAIALGQAKEPTSLRLHIGSGIGGPSGHFLTGELSNDGPDEVREVVLFLPGLPLQSLPSPIAKNASVHLNIRYDNLPCFTEEVDAAAVVEFADSNYTLYHQEGIVEQPLIPSRAFRSYYVKALGPSTVIQVRTIDVRRSSDDPARETDEVLAARVLRFLREWYETEPRQPAVIQQIASNIGIPLDFNRVVRLVDILRGEELVETAFSLPSARISVKGNQVLKDPSRFTDMIDRDLLEAIATDGRWEHGAAATM